MNHFWFALFKGTVSGGLWGFVAAVLVGGFASMFFGLPFSGKMGIEVFPSGMIFPGLFMFAPWATIFGAVIGAGWVLIRRCTARNES